MPLPRIRSGIFQIEPLNFNNFLLVCKSSTLLHCSAMKHIKAIGFDLFGTLVFVDKFARGDALKSLLNILQKNGFEIEDDTFVEVYLETVRKFKEEARRDHKETHNRYWICETLNHFGYDVAPGDPRITSAIQQYFAKFIDSMALLPGTAEMLEMLRSNYRLGLLSNFTHAPAVREALSRLKVDSYFEFILISGELGHRKPGKPVFSKLIEQFGMPKQQIAYVGDDPVADLQGALDAGIQPIWTRYAAIHTQRPLKELPESLEVSVPIVENWNDLLTLLNGENQI